MLEAGPNAAPPVSDRRRVAGSVAALAAGDLVNKAARFAAVVVLTHALPLDQYGLLNVGVALGGIAVVLTRLGLPDLGAREAAIAPQDRDTLAGRIITPQAASFGALTCAACCVVLLIKPGAVPFVLLSAASTLGLILSADWLLRGMERMVPLALATAAGGIVTLAGSLIVAAASNSALAGLAALAAGELIAAIWTVRSAQLARIPRPSLRGARGLLRESWPLAVAGAVTYAYYANIDTVLLAATRSVEEAGLYSGPYRLFLALNTTGIFAAYAILPLAARALEARAPQQAQALILGLLPALAGFGLLCLGVAEVLGGRLLEVVFGEPFGAMATTFVILCAAVPWYAVGYPVGYSAIASGHHRRLLTGAAVAAVLNLVLNAALIPPLGPEGAGIATTVAMVAAALTWLHVQQMLARVRPLVVLMSLSTLAAVGAALADDVRVEIGVLTLLAGTGLLAWGSAGGRRFLRARPPAAR